MVIQHNLEAANGNNVLGRLNVEQTKSTEKLSSGYRINRAADDAAGLTITETMRSQIRGLNRASTNAEDGISLIQVAEGALNEVHSLLQRARELAVQGANDTNTAEDRAAIQKELDHVREEVDRIADTTEFNTMGVFSRNGASPQMTRNNSQWVNRTAGMNGAEQSGAQNLPEINISYSFLDSNGTKITVAASQAVGNDTAYADSDMAKFVKKAAANAVSKLSAAYPQMMNRASSSTVNIGLDFSNIDGANGTLAMATLSMSTGSTSTTMTYSMKVDTSDYALDSFASMSDEKKADLAAVIAHEMTHLIMYDTTTDGMIGGSTYPKWFVEGMAQTSSGDNGWVSYQLSPSSDDASIKSYMSQLDSMPYGAGYLATMYLGQAASGSSTVNSTNIKAGLDKILKDLADKKDLDTAIRDNTSFSGLSDFTQKFKSGDASALTFVKNLLSARGTNGAGSLLAGSLSTTEANAFAPSALSGSASNYVVHSDNTRYANAFGTGYIFLEKGSGIVTGTGESGEALNLQVGALKDQKITLEKYDVSSDALFGAGSLNVSDNSFAGDTIQTIDDAIEKVSGVRSYYGAMQNRLEHVVANLDNTSENVTAAESRIRDTDMAKEVVTNSKNNILMQAAQSMMAQSNHNKDGVLTLLRA